MTGADIVTAARAYLGTPYRHQGRVRGVGIDCLGLLICTARDLGLAAAEYDVPHYTHQPDQTEFLAGLRRHLIEIPVSQAQPGDVLLLSSHGVATHVAFRTDAGVLHAYAPAGQVVEHGLRAAFSRAVKAAFRAPEVTNG